MPKKHHILMLGSVVFAFALILGTMACSSTPATPTQPPAADQQPGGAAAEPTQAAAATKPAEGGSLPDKLVIGYPGEPTNLDPPQVGGSVENVVALQIFDALAARTADGKVVPRLAEKWENIDPNTWRFTLRKGVKFHNGEELNAEVAKFSIERYKSPIAAQAARYKNITGVKIVDEYTFDVTLETPDPILPNSFVGNVYMLPPKYTEEKGDEYLAANPVGTGPYKFKEWVRGDHVTLEANPDYWQGKPQIQTVTFKFIAEASTRVAALQSKEIDIANMVPPSMVKSVEDGGTADVKTVPGPRAVYIGLWADGPTPVPAFKDKRVRQAMNYAVNRKGMVDKLLFGFGNLVGQPIPEGYLGHDPSIEPYPYDPEKAKALLAEAGYPDGFEAELTYASRWLTRDQAQVLQSDLGKVGIKVKLTEVEQAAFNNTLTGGKMTPMYSLSIQGRIGLDAIEIFDVAVITNGSFNWNDYSNPAADEAINKGRSATDPKEREKYFQQANQAVHDDPPWIFMWSDQSIWGVRKGLSWNPRTDDMIMVYDDFK